VTLFPASKCPIGYVIYEQSKGGAEWLSFPHKQGDKIIIYPTIEAMEKDLEVLIEKDIVEFEKVEGGAVYMLPNGQIEMRAWLKKEAVTEQEGLTKVVTEDTEEAEEDYSAAL
jgi:intein/homing endonuclease